MRSLHLDVQQDAQTLSEHLVDFSLECAIKLSSIFGTLKEFTSLASAFEFLSGEKVIRLPIFLARPRLASRRRHRIAKQVGTTLEQLLRDDGLPTARRSGENDDPRRHSRFSSCSRK